MLIRVLSYVCAKFHQIRSAILVSLSNKHTSFHIYYISRVGQANWQVVLWQGSIGLLGKVIKVTPHLVICQVPSAFAQRNIKTIIGNDKLLTNNRLLISSVDLERKHSLLNVVSLLFFEGTYFYTDSLAAISATQDFNFVGERLQALRREVVSHIDGDFHILSKIHL